MIMNATSCPVEKRLLLILHFAWFAEPCVELARVTYPLQVSTFADLVPNCPSESCDQEKITHQGVFIPSFRVGHRGQDNHTP